MKTKILLPLLLLAALPLVAQIKLTPADEATLKGASDEHLMDLGKQAYLAQEAVNERIARESALRDLAGATTNLPPGQIQAVVKYAQTLK